MKNTSRSNLKVAGNHSEMVPHPYRLIKQSVRFQFFLFLLIIFLLHSCATESFSEKAPLHETNKKTDLVLIHGLANKHRWSDSFLEKTLEIWGSGHVFVIYTGPETGITSKNINGRKLIIAGGNGDHAGNASIEGQVVHITPLIEILRDEHGLQTPFSIIAHSMGGLVARQYIYQNPDMVAGLVTLGTPHNGSPLADSFQWVGHFLNATAAIEDLKPENVDKFNKKYPVENTPLTYNTNILVIRGVPDGKDCFGWAGELFLGWQILSDKYNTGSDGLVPCDSALIKGVELIADFPHYDHYDLVRQPDIVKKAAEYLP